MAILFILVFILELRLAAKNMIRDWDEGIYAEDRVQHELLKKARKSDMLALSIKYGVASQWTSFVAIEKRKPGEVPQVLLICYSFTHTTRYVGMLPSSS